MSHSPAQVRPVEIRQAYTQCDLAQIYPDLDTTSLTATEMSRLIASERAETCRLISEEWTRRGYRVVEWVQAPGVSLTAPLPDSDYSPADPAAEALAQTIQIEVWDLAYRQIDIAALRAGALNAKENADV